MDKYLTIINSNNNFDTTATIDVSDNTLVSLEICDKTKSICINFWFYGKWILGDSIKKLLRRLIHYRIVTTPLTNSEVCYSPLLRYPRFSLIAKEKRSI